MNILTEVKTNSNLSFISDSKKLSLLGLRGSFSSIIETTGELLENNEINDIEDSIKEIHLNALESYTLLDNIVNSLKRNKKNYLTETDSVDLKSIINKVISLYKQKIISKKIEINLSIDGYSRLSYQENIVNMIVRNIILNAIANSPEGGRIGIATKRGSNTLDLVVIDTGEGLTPKDISWILKDSEMNLNLKSFDENHKKLGLKICKVYLERIKGDLIIGSRLKKGSRFEVKFPI